MGKQYKTNKQLMDELERAQQRIVELEKADEQCEKMEEDLRGSEKQDSLRARDEEGVPIRILGVGRNVGRKRVEDALQKSERRYSELYQNLRDGSAAVNMEGYITEFNPAMQNMLGYSAQELYSFTCDDITPEKWHAIERNILKEQVLQRGYSDIYEKEYRKKDGTLISVEMRTYLNRDDKGMPCGYWAIVRDIGERKILESQLRRAERMQTIGTLAGGIAHDFNNILSAIMGYADMALAEHSEDDRLRRYLEQVLKAGVRARDLVRQILTFSRQSDEQLSPLRISPIIKEVLKFLRSSLPATIRIHQNIQSDQDMVLADPTHIHQLLMNLCTNAAYAMRERNGTLGVTLIPVNIDAGNVLACHDLLPGKYLKLTVSDTGCGINPVIIDRIFDPFFTTKKPGEGVGMGLSVVHGIVKSYGGMITVESEVTKGTVFHVYLPLLPDRDAGCDAQTAGDIIGGQEKILFVDDEESLVHLGEIMLTSLGYDFTGKTDSREALELFRSQPAQFDLVIADMTMPNMTGLELASECMHIRSDIPVILCTGYSETITPEKARDNGLKDFIMKPMVKNQIAEAIRRALDRKE